MCLHTISWKRKKGKDYKEGFGWKIFDEFTDWHTDKKYLKGDFYNDRPRYPINKWMVRKRKQLLVAYDDNTYTSGFHIFATKKGAKDWGVEYYQQIRKVEYRRGTTIGKIERFKIIVAEKILILPNKNKDG